MSDKFIVKHKNDEKKEDIYVNVTLRMEKVLREAYDELAAKSERSRNELMCMALHYALDNLEFIPDTGKK